MNIFNVFFTCFMPWVLFGFWKVVAPDAVPFELVSLTWMCISPMVTGFGMLLAYREGSLS